MTLFAEGDDQPLREILRGIFAFYQRRGPTAGLTRTLLEKALWEFKVSLPPDDEMTSVFGFYWWLRGYYSDTLYHAIDSMVQEGLIELTDRDLMRMPEDALRASFFDDDALQARIEAFLPSLGKFDVYKPVEEVILQHYNLYAPNQFCLAYPRYFLPVFGRLVDAIREGRPLSLGPMDLRRISLERLDDATIGLPFESHYDAFRRDFMVLRTVLQRMITHQDALGSMAEDAWREIRELVEEFWELYCMFLREKYHDQSLEYRVSRWQDERRKRSLELGKSLDHLYDRILEIIGEEKLGEKLVDRRYIVDLVERGIQEDEIAWVDTDRFGLDWADLRTHDWREVAERLQQSPFRKVLVRYRAGRTPEEVVLKVRS